MKIDATGEMAFFVMLAHHGTLAAAARALDLTPPAVTRRLAQLEARLGVRLMNRSTRHASLTPEGQEYLQEATRLLAEIAQMEARLTRGRHEARGRLRINATLGFGRTVIAPLVGAFARQHSELQVELHLSDRPVDLVENGFDLAVRFGAPDDALLSGRRLMSNQRFLCASPAYLRRAGEPRNPAELAAHRCIVHRQNDETAGIWRFTHAGQSESVRVAASLASNDGDIVRGWALAGQGLLIRSEWDAAKYLASGRLRRVLSDYALAPADLYALYPGQRHLSARTRLFIDALIEHFAP